MKHDVESERNAIHAGSELRQRLGANEAQQDKEEHEDANGTCDCCGNPGGLRRFSC